MRDLICDVSYSAWAAKLRYASNEINDVSPSSEYWRWFRPPLGKKLWVLRSSMPCDRDCWHIGLSWLQALVFNCSRPIRLTWVVCCLNRVEPSTAQSTVKEQRTKDYCLWENLLLALASERLSLGIPLPNHLLNWNSYKNYFHFSLLSCFNYCFIMNIYFTHIASLSTAMT